jgi:hypothetical protein
MKSRAWVRLRLQEIRERKEEKRRGDEDPLVLDIRSVALEELLWFLED